MANCCVYFLFFSYAAATIIYLIIGALAASGNAAVLMEHCKTTNNTITQEEKESVKKRTYSQYFLASGFTLVISALLFFLCIFKGKKGYSQLSQNINNKIIEEKVPNVIDEEELTKVMTQISEDMDTEPPSREDVKRVLDHLDTDHSGKIDFDEFSQLIKDVLTAMIEEYN